MLETIQEVFLKEFDLVVGGVIVYFITLPIFKTLKLFIINRWHDLIGLSLAVIVGIVYGIIRNSALSSLEAIAGSQLIFTLVKKGFLSIFTKTLSK